MPFKTTLSDTQILFFDGLGALLSGTLLIVIIGNYTSIFGIPQRTAQILGIVAVMMAAPTFYVLLFKKNAKPFLKFLVCVNSLYILTTLGFILQVDDQLTVAGFTYFFFEVVIILFLIVLEFRAIQRNYV